MENPLARLTKKRRKKNPKYKNQNIHSFQLHMEHSQGLTDYILGHKTNLNKFKSIEIISTIFSDHSGMKLEINHRKRNEKKLTTWRLNNMLLKNQQVNEEIKKEIKKYLETNDNEDTTTQNLWDATKAVLRGKFTAIQAFLKKEEKSQIDNLTHHPSELEKEEQEKPKVSRKKDIIKI